MIFINKQLPPRADGKPRTNKEYMMQGFNAGKEGISVTECPYFASSTAEKWWIKGHKDATSA